MRAFAAVFTRELFERRFVFLVAFLAGFVPLIGSGLYGWSSPDAAEGRVLVALVGATALSAAFALLLGAAVIAGETKEKRISFFFARPIPSVSLWAGKLLAAIAITLATAFLAFTPGWLSGNARARNLWGLDATPGRTALAALALAVVFVLGSHAVVTVARLRSPWVALDLILGPALVFLTALALRSLARDSFASYFRDDERSPATIALIVVLVASLLGLVLATFVQVAEGRTDARRAHGAFSVAFFGISGLAVALLGGYAVWCVSAKATDLATTESVQAAPRGAWVSAAGPLRAWRGTGQFLFDTAGGQSLRVRTWYAVFSQDGARAAWGEPRFGFFERKDNKLDLFVADLATGRVVATGLEAAGWSTLALSPDGRRLAVPEGMGKALAVFDVSNPENPKQLAVFQVDGERRGLAFVDNDTLRVYPSTQNGRRQGIAGAQLEITELSLSSKKSLVTGRFDSETLPLLRLGPDARLFVGTRSLTDDPLGKRALTLHDGRTGTLVTTLAEDLRSPQLRFLTGGRIAVAGVADAKARLLFFEGEKTPARAIDLGLAARVALGGEISAGRVAVAINATEKDNMRGWKLVSADAASGAVSPLGDSLYPANRLAWWSGPVLPTAEAGSPSSYLFLDADGRLVRLDPATGSQTVLLGRSK